MPTPSEHRPILGAVVVTGAVIFWAVTEWLWLVVYQGLR
jgi:hypothetical protein